MELFAIEHEGLSPSSAALSAENKTLQENVGSLGNDDDEVMMNVSRPASHCAEVNK
jgi:hypothetical protein